MKPLIFPLCIIMYILCTEMTDDLYGIMPEINKNVDCVRKLIHKNMHKSSKDKVGKFS